MTGRAEDEDPSVGHEPAADPSGRRRHRPGRAPRPSLLRAAAYAASLAAIVAAAMLTPLPYVVHEPGSPTPIPPLIEVSGTDTTPIDGSTSLLTVFLRTATPVSATRVLLDPARELTPAARIAPGGLTPEFFDAQRDAFADTFEIATAVGARAAGVDVELSTEVVILDVLAGSPADGVLTVGDRVRAVDGRPLTDAAQLRARTQAAQAGDALTLTVEHGAAERDVQVELAPIDDSGQVGLGVLAETATVGIELPFEVALGSTRIGGPSAGMMTALTLYDLLSDEDLIGGRNVMGTGTVAADGRVGTVGGVPEKVRAAAANGADIVLVPSSQLEAALLAAPDGVEVIGVATVDEAIDALRG